MREVEFYALKSTVEKLATEIEQLKAILTNNAKVTAHNEEVLSDNLASASLLGLALLDELSAIETSGITRAKIISRIQELERSTIKEPEPEPEEPKVEDPHAGAFIFSST